MFFFFCILLLFTVFLNGRSDGATPIISCVAARSLSPVSALSLACICNLLGSIIISLISSKVAETFFGIVTPSALDDRALPSLCAGLSAVVIWSFVSFRFGIPTSGDHALLSGISGALIASSMSVSVIVYEEWNLIFIGLLLSTLLSFMFAKVLTALMIKFLKGVERRWSVRHFNRAQRWSAASNSFLHGAQNSQKFLGVFMLGSTFHGNISFHSYSSLLMVSLFSVITSLGLLFGGYKTLKKVSIDMVDLDPYEGTSSDMSSSAILALCSFFGIPVSTTHTKTCAMLGACSARNGKADRRIFSEIVSGWILTFPICALLGFLISFFIFSKL